MSTKREVEKQFKRVMKELEEEKMEIHIPRELLERMDRVKELLGIEKEEFILCAVRRLLDHYEGIDILVRL